MYPWQDEEDVPEVAIALVSHCVCVDNFVTYISYVLGFASHRFATIFYQSTRQCHGCNRKRQDKRAFVQVHRNYRELIVSSYDSNSLLISSADPISVLEKGYDLVRKQCKSQAPSTWTAVVSF